MGLVPVGPGFRLGRHVLERGVQARQRVARIVQVHIAVVQVAAVMRAQDEEAHDFRVIHLEHVTDGEEVAERLRHLLVVHAHEAVVHPGVDEGAAAGALGLGDLVFVVRELQVGAAAVQVEMRAEQFAAHRRALDVPARTALAPRRGPATLGRLVGLGGFPQHEVQRILLGIVGGHALSGAQVFEGLARQLAVARELAHRVVHVAVGRLVGQAVVLQPADHRQHLRHVFGGARLAVGALHAERVGIFVHGGDEAVGERADGLAVLDRALDDLVVDVGDVAHVGHVIPRRAQPALHHVEHHHHPRMPDVTVVVHRHPAHVHAHAAGLDGDERLFLTRERVVDLE